jgi:2,3-bisphosphoglycerate-independent phosphoglycerate mutase
MSRVLLLFMDGVGLGADDPACNPFAACEMPSLEALLGGRKLVLETAPYVGDEATLLAIDATLGLPGTPQSASGQATLLTGRNVPQEIGEHYGPKPNPPIQQILHEGNIFSTVTQLGGKATLLNAYPPQYFEAIERGHRLYSAIPLALTAAGLSLMTAEDIQAGRALSVDFTGEGWSARPEFPQVPLYSPSVAGAKLAQLAARYDLAWFDFWPSDYAGHRQDMNSAIALLETFDAVLSGLLQAWEGHQDLIVLTSDHGNLEDLSQRGHTRNPVPALLIGSEELRGRFGEGLENLTHFVPAIHRTLFPA